MKIGFFIFCSVGCIMTSCHSGKFQPRRKLIGVRKMEREFSDTGELLFKTRRISRSSGWQRHPHNMSIVRECIKEFNQNELVKKTKNLHRYTNKRWHEILKTKVWVKTNTGWELSEKFKMPKEKRKL